MKPETVSILFDRDPVAAPAPAEPACFADLRLDQLVEWLAQGREEYELAPLLWQPLRRVEAVHYRQLVVRDLERDDVRGAVREFAEQMRLVRKDLAAAEKLHYARQRQRWFLEAASRFCSTVESLGETLARLELGSTGLRLVREYLEELRRSAPWRSLGDEVRELEARLAEVRYMVHLKGTHVRVLAAEERPDLSSEVVETFEKFARGAVKDYRLRFNEFLEINHVEAQILEGVAGLYADTFEALERFCADRQGFLDETVVRFDREVQLYLAYLELIAPLREAGLPFTEPRVSRSSKEELVLGTFDLVLAKQLLAAGEHVVSNDFRLDGAERVTVVSGPNNGGKTTFARTFGQLHYLAGLGLPVPAGEARLFLADGIFTHFEREEEIETLRGKFEDELHRIHRILEHATADSVLILNEAFGSTTLHDARLVGTRVMGRIIELDALCVFVTFVDELAALGETVVSMMSTVVPGDPATRTFRLVRKPADGLAYAAAIAEKYGLAYDSLRRRIAT